MFLFLSDMSSLLDCKGYATDALSDMVAKCCATERLSDLVAKGYAIDTQSVWLLMAMP